ncbi:MAG: hypothetical protein KAJ19_00485 [Gammaproteobacteria bacterium]|nr:hypothetical protein [Gammaproteobacteria bacterium]
MAQSEHLAFISRTLDEINSYADKNGEKQNTEWPVIISCHKSRVNHVWHLKTAAERKCLIVCGEDISKDMIWAVKCYETNTRPYTKLYKMALKQERIIEQWALNLKPYSQKN